MRRSDGEVRDFLEEEGEEEEEKEEKEEKEEEEVTPHLYHLQLPSAVGRGLFSILWKFLGPSLCPLILAPYPSPGPCQSSPEPL